MSKAKKQPENCRHEFVRIYQRKLKGLERRLVATKAYLPVGFKVADFGHLSEGSFCFCSECRMRLFPKRTTAEKLQARLATQQAKAEAAALALEAEYAETAEGNESEEASDEKKIDVEELEIDAVGLEEISDSSVDLPEEEESI